ncbi:MAG: SpoIIE family protein phosphatase, partial [Verrucomicrobiae bacterium]|nr:SpoIIE family protein phosphatase [Verrucomicrobiae bacterium]
MNALPVPVLIVDDDEQFAALLQQLLAAVPLGITFAPHWVNSAAAARAAFDTNRFELVLLDNKLPGADGLDLLAELAQRPPERQPAVIMLTATGNEAIAVQAMKRGAVDYLPKLDLDLATLTRALHVALQRRQLEREIRQKNEQLIADLQWAAEIQRAFLPQTYPVFPPSRDPATSALRFTHRYRPTREVGGDFFDVFAIGDYAAGLFIGDVMGHGLRAALITAILRGLIEELMPLAADPGRFLTELNRGLTGILKQTRHTLFVSALYGVLDITRGELRFANAGHPSPIHVRRKTNSADWLHAAHRIAGPALALAADARYATATVSISAGDVLLFYTDGLVEVPQANLRLFGEDRLLQTVRAATHLATDALLDRLLAEAQHDAVSGVFTDD